MVEEAQGISPAIQPAMPSSSSLLDIFKRVSREAVREETHANVGRAFQEKREVRDLVQDAWFALCVELRAALNRAQPDAFRAVQKAKRNWSQLFRQLKEDGVGAAFEAVNELNRDEGGVGNNVKPNPEYVEIRAGFGRASVKGNDVFLPRPRGVLTIPARPGRGNKKSASEFKNVVANTAAFKAEIICGKEGIHGRNWCYIVGGYEPRSMRASNKPKKALTPEELLRQQKKAEREAARHRSKQGR